MKDNEAVKEFIDKGMKIMDQVRLVGEDLLEKRVVEKVLLSLLERFEFKISSIEESKNLSKLTLTKLVNAFHLRLDDSTKSAM